LKLLVPPGDHDDDVIAVGHQDGTLWLQLARKSVYLTGKYPEGLKRVAHEIKMGLDE
jgi:hypothetical protein